MSYHRSRSPRRDDNIRNIHGRRDEYQSSYTRDRGGGDRSHDYIRHGAQPQLPSYQQHTRCEERRDRGGYSNSNSNNDYNYGGGSGMGYVDFSNHNNQPWQVPRDFRRQDHDEHRQNAVSRNPDFNYRDRHHQGRGSRSHSGGSVLNSDVAEQHRVEASSRYPNCTFLEEVALPPEFAFRIDTSADKKLLHNESTRYTEISSFVPTFYRDNLLGATKEYITRFNVLSYKSLKVEETDEPNSSKETEPEAPGTSVTVMPRQKRKADDLNKSVEYIVLSKRHKSKTSSDKSNVTQKNSEMSLDEKREYYNVETRKNSENVQLWREFVEFQDQDCADFTKIARTEKKISILETALRNNPKSSELHFDRLDFMNEISKSNDVVVEWQKLVNANQDSEVLWLERFKYSCTQLQLFTSSSLMKDFTIGFNQLRSMLNSSYPEYQKPSKLHLLMPDLLSALCLTLRNSGFTEKAHAISQAQMEFDFNFPQSEVKGQIDKSGWKSILKLFELFWGLGTLRFGEPGYTIGWSKSLETNPEAFASLKFEPIGVPDSQVLEFEDTFFEAVNNTGSDSCLTRKEWTLVRSEKWILMESFRSKLCWTPWRDATSDISGWTCEDNARIILPTEITPYLTYVPSYGSKFEQQASFFRHIVNYLILLNQDFLPRTHTLESIMSPFSSLTLSDSTVFFSELNYWKKFLDLYYTDPKDGSCGEIIPEGFHLSEFTLPSTSFIVPKGKKLTLLPVYTEIIETQMQKLLNSNQEKYHNHLRCFVTQSIEYLDSKFASLLVQMLFRYEQKSRHTRVEDHKTLMNFCKNLMKHEKLRSSVELFMEIGLLDYFVGKKKKSVNFLIKTVNSSSKLLKESDTDVVENFLRENWETVTQVTKVYRVISEFYLKDQPDVAMSILVSLGNNFDLISLSDDTGTKDSKPSKHAILKAKRFFESIMDCLVPSAKTEENVIDLEYEETMLNGFGKWDGEYCIELFAQKSNLIVEWTIAYSLFAFLTDNGFDSASEIYKRIMDRLESLQPLSRSNKFSPLIVNGHNICEQLFISWCKLGALHVTQHPMQNSKFRTIFGKALEQFPSSPPLLLLYTTVESQCSVVGKLWRSMVNTIKLTSPSNICTLDWAPIFMCYGLAKKIEEIELDSEIALDEFGIGGPAVAPDTMFYKLDALFSAAENNLLTRNCPLIWRLHLKHLAIRAREGKDDKRAHGLCYDAIRRCPTNKAIYMDAIAYFPEMIQQITEIMSQKELVVRLPIEELDLLLQFNNQEEVAAKNRKKKTHRKGKRKTMPKVVDLEDGETVSDDNESEVEIVISD